MPKILVFLVCSLGCLWPTISLNAAQRNVRDSVPLKLDVSFDRKVYLEREPIFFEWTLSNQSGQPLRTAISSDWVGPRIFLEGTDGRGKKFSVFNASTGCGGRPS